METLRMIGWDGLQAILIGLGGILALAIAMTCCDVRDEE